MPVNASVKRILSAQETDSSLTLGLTVNGKAITTKQYIPKAGESFYFAHCLVTMQTWPNLVNRRPDRSRRLFRCS